MESEKSDVPHKAQMNPPPYSGSQMEGPPPQAVAAAAPVVVVPTMHSGVIMGAKPSTYTCPSCHASIVTRTERKATTRTHLFALGMCCICLWCCFCLPYCMDSCQNIDHYCPDCGAYIGSNKN